MAKCPAALWIGPGAQPRILPQTLANKPWNKCDVSSVCKGSASCLGFLWWPRSSRCLVARTSATSVSDDEILLGDAPRRWYQRRCLQLTVLAVALATLAAATVGFMFLRAHMASHIPFPEVRPNSSRTCVQPSCSRDVLLHGSRNSAPRSPRIKRCQMGRCTALLCSTHAHIGTANPCVPLHSYPQVVVHNATTTPWW